MSDADQPASWLNSSPWLDEYDGATSVRSVRQSPLEQRDAAPSEAYLQGVLAAENAASLHLAALSHLYGPYDSTWKYRASIESEVRRLSLACRESVGVERESNLRQLREAEAALREFCETTEFREAVDYAMAAVDRAIESAGSDLTPAQIAAKSRYAVIRKSLEILIAATSDGGEGAPVQDHPLVALVQGGAHLADPVRRGRKKSKAGPRLNQILAALESYAAETGQEFDRSAMPGPLGDDWQDHGSFHWLCAQIDPIFRRAKTTFEKHRAGLCALRNYAQKTDFYKRALPHIAPTLNRDTNVHQLPKRGIKTA